MLKSLPELYLNAGPYCFCPMGLLCAGHLAKDGGKAGWVESSPEMMLTELQQRADPSLTQAMALKGRKRGAAGLGSCLGESRSSQVV